MSWLLYRMEVTGWRIRDTSALVWGRNSTHCVSGFLSVNRSHHPTSGDGDGCDAFQHDVMRSMFSAKSKNTIAVDNGEGDRRCGTWFEQGLMGALLGCLLNRQHKQGYSIFSGPRGQLWEEKSSAFRRDVSLCSDGAQSLWALVFFSRKWESQDRPAFGLFKTFK